MKTLSTTERAAKTRRQIELVDKQLINEFSTLSADVVHGEVESVSEVLLAEAHFSDYVAVLTGRFAAEHLRAGGAPVRDVTRRFRRDAPGVAEAAGERVGDATD